MDFCEGGCLQAFLKGHYIHTYTYPNHFWVGAIDSSDRFEHVFDPQFIWKLFEKILRIRFWGSVLKIFFKEFSDTLWVENMFKPIRAINRTDSEVIWNGYMFNWNLSISSPATGTVKKKFSNTQFWTVNMSCRVVTISLILNFQIYKSVLQYSSYIGKLF